MRLPDYINCKNEEIFVCDRYMDKECEETCAYAIDIRGSASGAMHVEDVQRLNLGLEKEIEDEKESR